MLFNINMTTSSPSLLFIGDEMVQPKIFIYFLIY